MRAAIECATRSTGGRIGPIVKTRRTRLGLVETLLALGVIPVGIAEIDGYRDSVVEPPVPMGVPDVGLRFAPSLELLQSLAPDLILINSSQKSQRPMLERIAPVRAFAIYTDAGTPYRHAQKVTRHWENCAAATAPLTR